MNSFPNGYFIQDGIKVPMIPRKDADLMLNNPDNYYQSISSDGKYFAVFHRKKTVTECHWSNGDYYYLTRIHNRHAPHRIGGYAVNFLNQTKYFLFGIMFTRNDYFNSEILMDYKNLSDLHFKLKYGINK